MKRPGTKVIKHIFSRLTWLRHPRGFINEIRWQPSYEISTGFYIKVLTVLAIKFDGILIIKWCVNHMDYKEELEPKITGNIIKL